MVARRGPKQRVHDEDDFMPQHRKEAEAVRWWDSNQLPKTGGWILVKRTIPLEMPVDPMAVMYAKPKKALLRGDYDEAYFFELPKSYLKDVIDDKHLDVGKNPARIVEIVALNGRLSEDDEWNAVLKRMVLEAVFEGGGSLDIGYQVEVRNEFGVALLQPWEYSVLDEASMNTYLDSLKDQTAWRMYQFSNEQIKKSAANDAFKDRVYYLRTRGIPYKEAVKLLFGQIQHYNVFFLKPHDELIRTFQRDADQYIAFRDAYAREHLQSV